MKKLFLLLFVSFCFGIFAVVLCTGFATAEPPFAQAPNPGDIQQQILLLEGEVAARNVNLCNSINNSFWGAEVNPRFIDNCNGTLTDIDTGLMWEKKVVGNSGSCLDDDKLHSVSATCNWDDATSNSPGGWIYKLNNRCNNDPTVDCSQGGDADCSNAGVGGQCGFAGYRDWRVPEVETFDGGSPELDSIWDHDGLAVGCTLDGDGACIAPIFGPTGGCCYWSSISRNTDPDKAWSLGFNFLSFFEAQTDSKTRELFIRAVRNGP